MKKQDFEMYVAIFLIVILIGVLLWKPIPLSSLVDEKSLRLVLE